MNAKNHEETHGTDSKVLIKSRKLDKNEKPYECAYCEKTFSRSDNAKNNEMTHLNKKHKMAPQMLVVDWVNQNCNQIIEPKLIY